ncbi:carbohydrate ABC transporter permease [Clostridium sp. DJ247]|uniref:carbohydrate ABC transporter permease n=1 Tax=Clostridium sp. DJ247 TaxID=2726188 RepID=UPI001A9AF4F0|nr:sugar ABC transporter permease [Clostridium sp. DJ247]
MKTLRQIKKYKAIYLMMLPVLLYFIVFSYFPLILGMIQSFQKNKLIGTPEFTGISNYKEVLGDYQFHQAFQNSLTIGIGTQILTIIFALFLSLGINEVRNKFTKSAIQTVTYIPNLFSWAVVGGMWVFVLSTNGFINNILTFTGAQSVQFLAEAKYAQTIMILTETWKYTGYYAVLLLAGIVSINPNVFEAAQIDGASRVKQIRKIIIPHLVPTIKVIIMLGTMGLLRNFDQVFVMGNPAIMDKVRTLLLYIFTEGITQFKVGKATAAATMVLAATLVITFIIRKLIKYDEGY